ncbi:MAG: alpha/beta hydrolase [Xylophilus ampelinus]
MTVASLPLRAARAATAAASALLLAGCGGGNSNFVPEETRLQDGRNAFATNPQALPFAALEGTAAQTDRWSGTLGVAGYRIEVPRNWNGMLVMYAHGYAGEGNLLTVSNPAIRRHLIENGYAWAASSYSKNFYDVRAGVEDTNALANAFVQIAASNGRALAAPTRTYITGVSMGGHVTAAAIEDETLATARNARRYDGAVPMCGVLGDLALYDYFGAYQLAAQKLAGFPAARFPTTDWATVGPLVRNALFGSQTSFANPTAQGRKLKDVVMNLTGGPRPIFDQGFANNSLQNTVWGTFGRDGTINGILNRNAVDTTRTVYRYDAAAAELTDFNATIVRSVPAADANRQRSDGLRWFPKVNGEFRVPVVTIHTLGDMYVPFHMEQVYRARAETAGTAGMLVQRAIRAPSHCDFTIAEQAEAFKAMTDWVEKGVKPQGDDVATPAVLAASDYGCAYTRDAGGPDDSATVLATRRLMPSCPAR